MGTPYRMVVGMDLEESGDVALVEAIALSTRVGDAELHPVYAISADPAVESRAVDEMSRHLERALERLRDRVERIVASSGGTVKVRMHVRFGDPVRVLHQVAVDHDADLIVVGTHGRRGIERLLLGSVASDLLKVARVTVIVARPKDFTGLDRTPEPEAPRPGEPLHDGNFIETDLLAVGPRTSRISGLF